MFSYRAYELTIQSEFPIPELIISDGGDKSDVIIRYGEVPDTLAEIQGEGVLYQASTNQFLLRMDQVAHYLVQNGNEIIVSPRGDLSDIRVFLLGSAMGALLHQRAMLVLHAAAIYTEAGAVLFAGVSGSGKSTLLNEFLRRGYAMMVDDVCGVVVDDKKNLMVLPGYPRTRLWLDSAQKLGQNVETMERTRPTLEKYERQVPDQYRDQPAPLVKIYLLTSNHEQDIKLEVVPRIDGFSIVIHNTYRYQFLEGLAMQASHFGLVSAVAQQVPVIWVKRPNEGFYLNELANAIEQDLGCKVLA